MPQQFDNPANPAIHEKTTGPEIWEDSGHNIDAIVAGVGTGGTITGVARYIKPQESELQGDRRRAGRLAGDLRRQARARTRFRASAPGSFRRTSTRRSSTKRCTVSNEEAFQWARRLAKEEGIMGGISSGANMCAAAKVAARPEYAGKRIVTIMPSLGERYLSTPLFEGLTG